MTTTQIRNGRVVRTFSGRTEYINEDRAYELLRGTGLAPKLLYSFDNCIEHEIPEGSTLWDSVQQAAEDGAEQERLFGLWADWYAAFRKKTGFCLGGADLKDFTVTQSGFVCTSFEQCKKGYAESDMAAAIAQLYLQPQAFGSKGAALCRTFVKKAAEKLEYDPEILAVQIRSAIEKRCRAEGIEPDAAKTEYICVSCCMAPLILSGSGKSCGKLAEALEGIRQPWTFVRSADMPDLPPILVRAMMSADKEGFEAVAVEAEGELRDFPMLLRTDAARYDMELAESEGITSPAEALRRRPVKIVRIEDLEVRKQVY